MEYILTSVSFKGFLKFSFDDQGTLQAYENNATMNDKHHHHLRSHFPYTPEDLMTFNSGGTKVELHLDVTFETFWEKYDYKKGKIKAREQWNKLNDEAKFMAISYIAKYKYDCKLANTALLYPERYIKFRRWDDE